MARNSTGSRDRCSRERRGGGGRGGEDCGEAKGTINLFNRAIGLNHLEIHEPHRFNQLSKVGILRGGYFDQTIADKRIAGRFLKKRFS